MNIDFSKLRKKLESEGIINFCQGRLKVTLRVYKILARCRELSSYEKIKI